MKKTLLLGILGLAASVATSFGQGTIALSNYSTSLTSATHPLQDVIYGTGSGGTVGAKVANTSVAGGPFTAGLYWVTGSQVGAFAADPTGTALPTSLFSGTGTLALAAGLGATGGIGNADTGTPGEYGPSGAFNPGVGAGVTITCMTVAYNDGSYANATVRGHSTAYTIATSSGVVNPFLTGVQETDGGFSVLPVPEPSVLALSGIGAAALMLVRRKK
jgi:hypothetical protein